MTQTKHTPGPWVADIRPHVAFVIDGQSYTVCSFSQNKRNMEANAALIAAAPDLLEALKDLIGYAEHRFGDNDYHKSHGCMINAMAAVKKAEGR